MLRSLLVFSLLLTCFTASASAETSRFLRYPHISNDGTLAFSYHGDIWVLEKEASRPRRLTAHIADDSTPRFSPDGKQIAFVSNRMGNDDVFVVPTAGGVPRQVTHHSTGDRICYWTPDGKGILIATSRSSSPWGSPLFIAPVDGSLPTALKMDRGAAGMISQDGKHVAFNRTGFRYWRKHYRGNNNTDIWVQPVDGGDIVQLTDKELKNFREHTQDALPMWGADGWIYFLSERDDIFNIWRIQPSGGEPEQVTRHGSDGVQYPAISPDGKTIVYENEFMLWRYELGAARPEKLEIDLSFDPKENGISVVETENNADGFAPLHDGAFVAVEYHGEIFTVPSDKEVGEMTRVTNSAWRDRYPDTSPDGKLLAYISDQSGDEEIWLYDFATRKHRQLTEQESTKRSYLWSPDSKQIVFEADSKLYLIEVEDGKISELAHNPEGGFSLSSYSTDGKWLVYSRENEDLNSEVYLFDLESRKEINVTQSRFREYGGELSHDKSHVAFLSDRSGSSQLYVVSLKKLTEDPDDPLLKWQKKQPKKETKKPEEKEEGDDKEDDDKEGEEGESKEADAEEKSEKKSDELVIDLEGIEQRAKRVTNGSGVRSLMSSLDGKRLYYTQGNELHMVGFDGEGDRKIADGGFRGLTLSGDGKKLFFMDGRRVAYIPATGGGKKQIDFEFRFLVDKRDEWEQMFEEAWRVMKYRFYDPDMHGYDWEAIKQQYKPLLDHVGQNQDLYDLCNEMIGELNASHTGVSGPPTRSMESLYRTHHLGFEMVPQGDYYEVSYIYPKGPADKEWLDLKVGDRILEVEGETIHNGDNYYEILNHLLNDYVDLTVATPAESEDDSTQVLGPSRNVRIRAVTSLGSIPYEAWVEGNRTKVDEWSNGKVGYVHIRSMNSSSLARFQQEINQFWNKNGMIIDIRYNGGGNIDQQLIDILERRPYEYWNSRMGGRARGRRPFQAIAGPKVMLINWRSASDSEVTPQAFRDLELGRIVGNPTYGAVIATGGYSLMNGASIRTPGALVVTYDPSQPNNYGLNLENFGVAPDVWVENSPKDELDGYDRELKTAVDEALKMLAEGDWQYGEDDMPEEDESGEEE